MSSRVQGTRERKSNMKPKNKQMDESDDSDDDYSPQIKKKNTTKKKEPMPDFDSFGSIENSEYAKKMLQARGFDINEKEFAKESTTKPTTNPKTGTSMLPSQAMLSLADLESELAKAYKANDKNLAVSLIDTILSKDMPKTKKREYLLKFSSLVYEMKKYKACIDSLKQLQATAEHTLEQSIENHRVYALLAKCKIEAGYKADGFTDYQRAVALLPLAEAQTRKISSGEQSWLGEDFEFYKQIFEELTMLYQLKINKEKSGNLDFALTANIGGGGLKTLFEFRNRKVLNIACGDHHTIALVECAYTNLYELKSRKKPQEADPYGGDTYGQPLVFGWGENTLGQVLGHTEIENVERPTLIPSLIGKKIACIAASRAASACAEKTGEVYEWGFNRNGIEKSATLKEEVTALAQSQHALGIITNAGKIWMRGHFEHEGAEFARQDTLFQFNIAIRAKQIAMGSNHLMVLSDPNKIYVVGSNSKGQLGIGKAESLKKEFVNLEIPHYHGKPTQIFAWNDISGFINQDGELFMWGVLTPNVEGVQNEKILWAPQNFELSQANAVISLSGTFRNVYAIPDTGVLHAWDLEEGIKFKPMNDLKDVGCRQIFCTRNQLALVRNIVKPSLCFIQEKKDEEPLQSFVPFTLSIQLMDEYGKYSIKPWHPVRFFVYIGDSASKKPDELEEMALSANKSMKPISSDGFATFFLTGDPAVGLFELKSTDEPGVYDLNLSLDKEGKYYLYVVVNEELIKGMPRLLDVSRSNEEDRKRQEEENKLKKEMENRARAEELRLQKLREAQEAQEEKERRLAETNLRAEERYKEHLLQQKEAKQREEEERRQRKELLVGGGYDIEKLQAMRKAMAASNQSQEETKQQPTLTKASSKIEETKQPSLTKGLSKNEESLSATSSSTKIDTNRSARDSTLKSSTSRLSKPGSNSGIRSSSNAQSKGMIQSPTLTTSTTTTAKPSTGTGTAVKSSTTGTGTAVKSTATTTGTKPVPVTLGSKNSTKPTNVLNKAVSSNTAKKK